MLENNNFFPRNLAVSRISAKQTWRRQIIFQFPEFPFNNTYGATLQINAWSEVSLSNE